jgi:hypothetical protein
MSLSIPALQALDRFTRVMLGAKFEPTGREQIVYGKIVVRNRCGNTQSDWLEGGPNLYHELDVKRYDEGARIWFVFSVQGREYCAQNNEIRDFIRANMPWEIDAFDATSVTFTAGDAMGFKQYTFKFSLNA